MRPAPTSYRIRCSRGPVALDATRRPTPSYQLTNVQAVASIIELAAWRCESVRILFLAFLFLTWIANVLCAQSTNASLSGLISDPRKARIADARVAAISVGTNNRYEASTNAAGEYFLVNLPPGAYRIEVEKPSFKKLIKPDVILHVQDVLVIDFDMAVGSASESITVEGGLPLVNTESATVSTVVDSKFVEDLPLNGRTFQTLIMLTPGVVVTQAAFDDQGQFSVNGQRADANYFTVDGVSASFGVTGFPPLMQSAGGALPALSAAGGTNSLVSVDAMREFRVQTSSFAPEFGRAPGGQVAIETRSGTNTYHGSLFEYFRNDFLDARDWFVSFNHLHKPAERQNDFGGVFGGPVIKDKTFFFFSYEGLRLRQPATQETVVPDMASRQVQTPTGPSIRPFLNAYPVPNGAEVGQGLAQFNAGFSNPYSLDAYSIRVDHVVNSKLTLFGRYSHSPSSVTQRGPMSTALSTTESVDSSVHTLTVGSTQLITPQISNEVRANYSNDRVGSRYGLDHFGGAVPVPDSLIFPSPFSSANSFFELIMLDATNYIEGKYGTDEQRQVNFIDNLSVVRGGHQLKFGIDYRWLAPFSSPLSYGQAAVFSGTSSSSGGALSGTALLGESLAIQSNALLAHNDSLYGQDTWKITTRLTATYGLRWDVNPPLKGKNSGNDPFTVTGLNNPTTITLAPRGTPLYRTTYGNVAPRFGLVYQLRGGSNFSSVLRAGFGVFHDLGYGSLGGVSSFFPYETIKVIPSATFPLSSQDAAPPPFTTNPPVSAIIVADPHLELPRIYEWNGAVEQSIGSSQALSITYVGAIGRKLLRVSDLVNVNNDFGLIALTSNTATSDYHALQVKFERRLSRGLQALGSYTFSHSIDSASTDAFADNVNSPGIPVSSNVDRGNSDFDIRHSFTAGVTYNVPSPPSNEFARAVLGGWSVDSFVLARSAPPVNLVGAVEFFAGAELFLRPNENAGVPLVTYNSQDPGGKNFNMNAFSPPPTGKQGNFPRNVLRGFGAFQTDFALQREFHVTETMGLRFRGEFFNIFNHPNFGPPNNNLAMPLFGYSTQSLSSSLGSGGANGGLNPLYQLGGPRSIQLALKLQF